LLNREDPVQKRWLSQIVFWILALSLILAFCCFATSLCVTLLLASFLAIVVDPLIMYFERWRILRTVGC
jgi:predicted PurR-regulated permease PerM